jgi:gluconate 2-dehydrogenase gamma chain
MVAAYSLPVRAKPHQSAIFNMSVNDKLQRTTKVSDEAGVTRREVLTGTAWLLAGASTASAQAILGGLPWTPNSGNPPVVVKPGPWQFFTPEEGRAVEAIADRVIPPDPQTPGGKETGSAVFIDRQIAGPYGRQDGLYVSPPYETGAKNQGPQGAAGPAEQYRNGLAALDRACKADHGGRSFADLGADDQDVVLNALEHGTLVLEGVDGKAFFDQVVKDVQMAFFADPLYGGNKDMAGWKMIGFPGARYNYLDWVNRHNEKFPLPPVGLTGRAEWTPNYR